MLQIANHQIEVWRKTSVTNARGVTSRKYYRLAMGVPAYVEEKTGSQGTEGGQPRSRQTGEAFLPSVISPGITLRQDDQIRFGDGARILRIDRVEDVRENESFSSMVRVFWTEADNAEV